MFLLIDSFFGMYSDTSIVTLLLFDHGDLKWLLLGLEMLSGGLVLIHVVLNSVSDRWRATATILTPIVLAVFGFVILEIALSGIGRSAKINLNLASVGFSGLYWAAAYLTVAIGLTLTYKIQRFGNFAQAEMVLVGAYVALTLMWSDRFFSVSDAPADESLNWSLYIWAAVAAFIVTGLLGLVTDRVVYKHLRGKLASAQVMMITSLGVAMVIRAVLYMRYSARTFRFVPDRDWRVSDARFELPTERIQVTLGERVDSGLFTIAENVRPYGATYTKSLLIIGIFGAVLLMVYLLHRTRYGRQMRAVADNPDLSASSGINVERVYGTSAFLSAGISGFGGALLAAILPINPELGISLLLPAFAVIVLGTIGSLPGLVIGALIVGLVRAISDPLLIGAGNALDRPTASGFAEVMPFLFLIGVLLLTPRGIGHAVHQWSIERTRKRRESGDASGGKRSPLVLARDRLRESIAPITRVTSETTQQIGVIFAVGLGGLFSTYSFITGFITRASTRSKLAIRGGIRLGRLTRNTPIGSGQHTSIDRETNRGSWIVFGVLLVLLVILAWALPSVSTLTKTLQIARIVSLVGIFGLMAFSLNLHTGLTGMTNFGVIFFVGIGAVTVGLLAVPVESNGYGWSPWTATILAVTLSGAIGWLLAYPTSRLRVDYFAIVTISLGEMLRISLQAEPMLRAGTATSAIGISRYNRPLESWWESGPSDSLGSLLGLSEGAPYVVFLAILSVVTLLVVWYLLDTILSSPWGRILRSIREDEEVSQHHGHPILRHKAASLALGAAIAALAGALWAWLNTSIFPDFIHPVRSTFLVWAAFIVGGRGNNRGMIIGAFLVVIVEFVFNVMVVARGSSDLAFNGVVSKLDGLFEWFINDLGGLVWSSLSVSEPFPKGDVLVELTYLKVALIGLVIVGALMLSSKGLLPEIPGRPNRTRKASIAQDRSGVQDLSDFIESRGQSGT
jgi:ABC-type branched-subunit amino acid transport system permease subunit